jgi:hypothetical protein
MENMAPRYASIALLVGSSLLASPPLWAGTGPGETFRTAGGILLLRELLNTPEAWTKLQSLSAHMALWKLSADLLEAPPDERDCPAPSFSGKPPDDTRRLQLVFHFGSHSRRSSRVWKVRYGACALLGGAIRFEHQGEGFGSAFDLEAAPVLEESRALAVLKQGLNNVQVYEELALFEQTRHIGHLQISKQEVLQDYVRYEFVVAETSPEDADDQTGVLKFDVLYDLSSDTTIFSGGQGAG